MLFVFILPSQNIVVLEAKFLLNSPVNINIYAASLFVEELFIISNEVVGEEMAGELFLGVIFRNDLVHCFDSDMGIFTLMKLNCPSLVNDTG